MKKIYPALIVLILFAIFVIAPTIQFTVEPGNTYYNVSERSTFTFDFNSSYTNGSLVDETQNIVIYELGATNLSGISINSSNGILIFAPSQLDVNPNATVTVTVKNATNGFNPASTTIGFNITNVNDRPNITGFSPSYNASVNENSTLYLSINASDPDSAYGDNISYAWYVNSSYVTNLTNYSYSPGFCEAGGQNITVIVTDSYQLSTRLYWNITVNDSNRPPLFSGTISNFTINEDSNLSNNLTLNLFFNDTDDIQCGGNFGFGNISYQSNTTTDINITIDRLSGNVSIYPRQNFASNLTILFIANDSQNISYSNAVTIFVTNLEDLPTWGTIANSLATLNVSFNMLLNASDPDLNYGDNLTFFKNLSGLFNITKLNSTHALINFTPSSFDVGNYTIQIGVNDTTGNISYQLWNLTIRNNTNPVIYQMGSMTLTQGFLFNLLINASDAENSTITFSINSSLFSLTQTQYNQTMVNFTPTNDQVGNYTILITATDEYGAGSSELVNFTILNQDDFPTMDFIGTQIAVVNRSFILLINASDLDLKWQDVLSLSINVTNATFFNYTQLNLSQWKVNFTPNSSQVQDRNVLVVITDALGNSTNQSFLLRIVNTSAPILEDLPNITAMEDINFSLQFNSSDADFDTITISLNRTRLNATLINVSMFNVSFGLLVITPLQFDVGTYSILATASDPDNHTSTKEFVLTIQQFDDSPYFANLTNLTAYQNQSFLRNITAYDEEIIFGSAINLNISTNSSIFNLTRQNQSTYLINFTPTVLQVGNYSIQVNISDGNSTNISILNFYVLNQNDPPQIVSYSPLNQNLSLAENSSQEFNITALDPDLILGDNISILWLVDGINQTQSVGTQYANGSQANRSFSYIPDFCQSGYHNITGLILDSGNASINYTWEVNVSNLNRPPYYGRRIQSKSSDFLAGTFSNTSAINSSDNVTLLNSNSGFIQSGSFVSAQFDLGSKYRFSSDINITMANELQFDALIPDGTNISVGYRTSEGSGFTNWSNNYTTSPIVITPSVTRYIQYRVFMATNDTNITPTLQEVRLINSHLNLSLTQNTQYTDIMDLADYFTDDDYANCSGSNRDNITYGTSSNDSLRLAFSGSKLTVQQHSVFAGTITAVIFMNDSYNGTSDKIVITIAESVGSSSTTGSSSSSGGGGGGSSSSTTQIQTKVIFKNITNPILLDLIVPKPITIYENDTIKVPIFLRNNNNFTLSGINLEALVNASGIDLSFSQTFFKELQAGQEARSELSIHSYNALSTYEIVVKAKVDNPNTVDSASFFVSSIEQGSKNASQVNTKITFARDLLSQNNLCTELNENLLQAQEAIKQKDFAKADAIVTSVIDSCRYLASLSPQNEFPLAPKKNLIDALTSPIIIGFIIIMSLIVVSAAVYRGLLKGFNSIPSKKDEQEALEKLLKRR